MRRDPFAKTDRLRNAAMTYAHAQAQPGPAREEARLALWAAAIDFAGWFADNETLLAEADAVIALLNNPKARP
jgi:hypothetical protein